MPDTGARKILYYNQDPGGFGYTDPVLLRLLEITDWDWQFMLHPFAAKSQLTNDIYQDRHVPIPGAPPVAHDTFVEYLRENRPDAILCTTSAKERDPSNANLITAARELDIPCVAALDHWKGFYRFFTDDGEPLFFPAGLLCIDDETQRRLGEAGLPVEHIFPIGHPALETIPKKPPLDPDQQQRILLVSQPDIHNDDFEGIFAHRDGGDTLVARIAEVLRPGISSGAVTVSIRFHPKEKKLKDLPAGVSVDDSENWRAAMESHDIFIGLDTIALVEASIAGAICITLDISEFDGFADQKLPFVYSRSVSHVEDINKTIEDALVGPPLESTLSFEGSSDRGARSFINFVETHCGTAPKNER